MSTVFATPVNNASSSVGPSGYTAGSFSLTLAAGGGSKFPALTGSNYYRITVIQVAFAYSPTATTSNYTIYKVTGVSGDTLTLSSTPLEGTSDRAYSPGDIVEIRVTSGTLSDIQGAINTLEAGGGGGVTVGNAVSGGTNNTVLYVNGSGNLASSGKFKYDESIGLPGLQIGDGTGNVDLKFNMGGTNCFAGVDGYLNGTQTFSLVWDHRGQFGGTSGTTSGRSIFVFDNVTSTTPGALCGPDGGFYWGGVTWDIAPYSKMGIRQDGTVRLPVIAASSAVNSSLFIDSANNKLAWKDSSGVVTHTS
jgi:hypothetical protein